MHIHHNFWSALSPEYLPLSLRFSLLPPPVITCMPSRFSRVQLFVTLWTVAGQVPLSMGFSRQEFWSGLPLPSPGDLIQDWTCISYISCIGRWEFFFLSLHHRGSPTCYYNSHLIALVGFILSTSSVIFKLHQGFMFAYTQIVLRILISYYKKKIF